MQQQQKQAIHQALPAAAPAGSCGRLGGQQGLSGNAGYSSMQQQQQKQMIMQQAVAAAAAGCGLYGRLQDSRAQ
jgi:hypothetical protein